MSEIRFDNRVAIVTGAGAGIGREHALELARRGAKVVVNDLGSTRDGSGSNRSAADEVVTLIKEESGQAVANYDSVSTMAGGENIVQTAVDNFGTVDILINNAGILKDRTFLKMTEADWDEVIAVHLKGAFCVTQPAAKIMKDKNYGRIVFTSSTSGLYGNFGQSNYGAAKMGLVGLMNTLKLELAKYNILVNCIAPNALSRMTEDIFDPAFAAKIRAQFNVPIALFLCSAENPVSGMAFAMGGGWYGRTAVVSGNGACIGDAKRDISVEEIRDNFEQIVSLQEVKPHDTAGDILGYAKDLLV